MCEIRMMSRVALNANSPTLLRHSKNECPAILWIQVSICQHEQALILLKLNIRFQVVKYLARVELLHFGVGPDTRLHNFLSFQHIKTTFKTVFIFTFSLAVLLYAYRAHTSEKYLEY